MNLKLCEKKNTCSTCFDTPVFLISPNTQVGNHMISCNLSNSNVPDFEPLGHARLFKCARLDNDVRACAWVRDLVNESLISSGVGWWFSSGNCVVNWFIDPHESRRSAPGSMWRPVMQRGVGVRYFRASSQRHPRPPPLPCCGEQSASQVVAMAYGGLWLNYEDGRKNWPQRNKLFFRIKTSDFQKQSPLCSQPLHWFVPTQCFNLRLAGIRQVDFCSQSLARELQFKGAQSSPRAFSSGGPFARSSFSFENVWFFPPHKTKHKTCFLVENEPCLRKPHHESCQGVGGIDAPGLDKKKQRSAAPHFFPARWSLFHHLSFSNWQRFRDCMS